MGFKEMAETVIKRHEGYRPKPYKDTKNILTIGYGRNLDDVGIYPIEAQFMLDNDIDDVITQLESKISFWESLSDVRKTVLIDMAYNLKGRVNGLLKFSNMLKFSEQGKFGQASVEILKSKYATDVKGRAVENAKAYESNVISL